MASTSTKAMDDLSCMKVVPKVEVKVDDEPALKKPKPMMCPELEYYRKQNEAESDSATYSEASESEGYSQTEINLCSSSACPRTYVPPPLPPPPPVPQAVYYEDGKTRKWTQAEKDASKAQKAQLPRWQRAPRRPSKQKAWPHWKW